MKFIRKYLVQFLVHKVFNIINEEDLLEIKTPNRWKYRNVELNEKQIIGLRNQAIVFYKSDLWKILKNDLKYQAQYKALVVSKTEEDIVGAKLMLYLTEVVDKKLKLMMQEKE